MQHPVRGVIVASVLPFNDDLSIDWEGYGRILDYCGTPKGITAVFVNGHAAEGASLTATERKEVIAFSRRRLPGQMLIAGIIALSPAEAVEQAIDARKAGADIGCVFPLPSLQRGGGDTEAAVQFIRTVAEKSDLPLAVFQYPLSTGFGYSPRRLLEIAEIPGVVMIKEGSGDVEIYEDNWRRIKTKAPHVSMMGTSAGWLAVQITIGADGILSGLASLTPHWLVELWDAAERQDMAALRAVNDKLYPVVRALYGAPPKIDMHTRIKVVLKHLGLINSAAPRAPLLPLTPEAEAAVLQSSRDSGLAAYLAAPR